MTIADAWRPAGGREIRIGLAGLGTMGRNHLRLAEGARPLRLESDLAEPGLLRRHEEDVDLGLVGPGARDGLPPPLGVG